MRAVLTRLSGIAVYLAFVAGVGSLCFHLAGHFATHAMIVAQPYLAAKGERRLTLVERRRIEAAVVAVAGPPVDDTFIPDAPATPLPQLAAQMDISETSDLAKPARAVRNTRARAAQAKRTRVAAADVFGRSFGVIVTASR